MDVLEAIRSRRSVREFSEKHVDDKLVGDILTAGVWAPSGLNNQPWKFKVLNGVLKDSIAGCTRYGRIIRDAPVCIAVFLDENEGYDRTKDVQAIGACIQNMLLAAHSIGLGGVWLGEILNQREKVRELLGVPESCELMAVIAIGWPNGNAGSGSRGSVGGFML
ncbi:MAG: nitroreductase [Candidatus Altiarchaeota archaeon]